MEITKEQLLAEKHPLTACDLFITERCNLKCTYCFHKQNPVTLKVEDGKKILDNLYIANPEFFNITFFGGEPLLYPELVLELAEYAVTLWGLENLKFTVSTNGMYFDELMFKKYKDLNFRFQVSLDGDEETSTLTRKGIDFNRVCNNLQSILALFPKTHVRMTYTPENVGRLISNVMFVHRLGVKTIMFHATMESDWTKESIAQYIFQLKEIYSYRRYINRLDGSLEIAHVDKPLNIINGTALADEDFCKAGKEYVAILPNGDVYPCHRAASNRLFKLGNILNVEMPIIRGVFLKINKHSTGCSAKCPASKTCHSCIIQHYMKNDNLEKPKEDYCQICIAENGMAYEFLPFELAERQDKKLNTMARVLLDLADQNAEFKDMIVDILKTPEEKKENK